MLLVGKELGLKVILHLEGGVAEIGPIGRDEEDTETQGKKKREKRKLNHSLTSASDVICKKELIVKAR